MVMLEISHKRLCDLVGKKFTVKELDDVLFDMGFELDDVDGDNLKIEVTTERIDCISPQGMARTLKAYWGISKGLLEYKSASSGVEFIIHDSLRKIRPFAVACIVKGLKFSDEFIRDVIWVQEKLHSTYGRDRRKAAIGIYPLKGIVPPVNFKAEVPSKIRFVPLEFDREMTADEILVHHPTGIKYASLLKGFDKYPVLYDSAGNVLSMPPIINSQTFGKVSDDTKDVFIEVTGTDWVSVNQVLTILACMFSDAGGKICSVKVVYSKESHVTPVLSPDKMNISVDYINGLLGCKFSAKEIVDLLSMSGFGATVSGKNLTVLVPCFRTDILHPVDVVDDIARAYGFNNFVPELPKSPTIGSLLPRTVFNNRVRELMIGHEFLEVFTRALSMPEDQFEKFNLPVEHHISVSSPRCPESVLRVRLTPELVKCFQANIHGEFPQKIFEVNDVVLPDADSDVKSSNETHISVAICSGDASFTEAKKVLMSLKANLGLDFDLLEKDYPCFIPGRSAVIVVKNKEIGFIGELHPQVLTNFGLKNPVSAFELSLESFY